MSVRININICLDTLFEKNSLTKHTDYDSFMKPLFDQKSINIRIWTLTDDVTQDIRKLPKKLDQILEESREINIWDFVVKAEIKVVKIMILRVSIYLMIIRIYI